MRRFSQLTIILLCISRLPAFPQGQPTVARIAVALLNVRNGDNQATEARDALVKALNHHKPDKKLPVLLHADGLDVLPGGPALDEARSKGCEYVLYFKLQALERSRNFSQDSSGAYQNLEIDTAMLEYEIRRVTDGVNVAIGMVRGSPSDSGQGAILNAIARIPNKLEADLKNAALAPPTSAALSADAKQPEPGLEYTGADFCAWLPKDISHADALRSVCQYSASERERLPNFVCQQETSRYQGHRRVPTDLITATIRYVDGEESYTDLKRNGQPLPDAMWNYVGLWSSGQFEGNLRAIFHFSNHAVFAFAREDQIGARAAWVFTYQITRQYDPQWELRDEDQVAAPPYEGEVWVEEKTGNLLRFRSTAGDLPPLFPMRGAGIVTDYDSVAFPDGSGFVLPLRATITTSYRDADATRNVVEFRGCHKFRATSRMIPDGGEGSSGAQPSVGNSSAGLATEIEESEKIYAILREEAITQDAARLELEQQQELRGATGAAFFRLAQLNKQREKLLASNSKNMRPVWETDLVPGANGSTTFRVKVKLVPVSIVVRDRKGHVVGNLGRQDFELLDDRKPQEITTFSVERSGADADRHGSEIPRPESDVAYVFDDLHTESNDLSRARSAVEKRLGEMRPSDRWAIYSTSGEITVDFTADQRQLQAGLRRLRSHLHGDDTDCPPMTYYQADLIANQGDPNALTESEYDALDCGFPQARGASKIEQQGLLTKAERIAQAKAYEVASLGRADSEQTIGMLHEVFAETSAMPGRRTIIVLSPGFLVLDRGQQQALMNLIERALGANVVISGVDIHGLSSANLSAANHSLLNSPSDIATRSSQEVSSRAGVMADLAYSTGGTFFHNNNDLERGLELTASVPECIYVLGFSPKKLDGKFHRLKVKISGGGELMVQARSGYYALRPAPAQ